MILLDTHIWLWWLLGDGNLKDTESKELDQLAKNQQLSISWVTMGETEMLERKGRMELFPDLNSWIRITTQPEIVSVLPADTELVLAQRKLPESFHADPADRLITATSILSSYPLATHDRRITNSDACTIWEP